MIFRSWADVEAYYCPKAVEKRRRESLSPEEYGRELARETLEELRRRDNDGP